MIKTFYARDMSTAAVGSEVTMSGWLVNRRRHGKLLFLEIGDSTGEMQAVFEKGQVPDEFFASARSVPLESVIEVKGRVRPGKAEPELAAESMTVINPAVLQINPRPRAQFDVFASNLTAQMQDNRHLYLRNPQIRAILQFRSELMHIVRDWFYENEFLEFDAPILTSVPLYDGKTAMPIKVHGEDLYLSQCAGFYLEAAAQAFDRVFNMGPSFRGEESRSKRHLMEYWHIKAEMSFGDREDIMNIVEDLLSYVTTQCQSRAVRFMEILGKDLCVDALRTPYPRVTYEDAVTQLRGKSLGAAFGEALSTAEEETLSKEFHGQPFWIMGIPRSVEPFPYVIDADDPRVTKVADLIASNGCGELLGVAEKIHDPAMLNERLAEKGKLDDPRYQFVKDVHNAGCAPHIAFGMGLERLIRWLTNTPHVRDAIPFPRAVGRKIYP